jgi:hypothetical protein
VLRDLGKMTGVEAAAVASFAPLAGALTVPTIPSMDREGAWRLGPSTKVQIVSDEYFRLMRIPVLLGRGFSDDDVESAPCVAVANEALASAFGGREDAIGTVISANGGTDQRAERCSIVGIVGSVRDVDVEEDAGPSIYFSHRQQRDSNRTLLIRSSVGSQIIPLIRAGLLTRDGSHRIASTWTVQAFVEGASVRRRALCYQILFFAVVGCAVALFGVFGVVDHFIGERRAEIALRLTLGALPSTIVGAVCREFASIAAVGAALGCAVAYVGSQWSAWWMSELPAVGPGAWLLGVLVLGISVMASAAWPIAALRTGDLTFLLRGN